VVCGVGLAHRQLRGVESIGVDEIHWGHGKRADNFLTVIYQIDAGCRRLLWIGKRRSEKTLRRGLKELGPEFVKGLRFVCSDMWKPYLKVIADQAAQALHVLDRFHITCPREAQRPADKQAGDGQSMGTERSLPALLEIPLAPLGFRIPGLLVPARYAQPPRTDQESCAYVTRP